ncbi:hypothetical protein SAMN02949497_3931 [Methylomagnum ishizawai]|uniref:Uncharacterized protein n=1 Tax=Methylomagnum ishizawai TaxID=1760988 RepID=A0A1Y6D1P4_9GAMM|nr:hypothetical protein [Methylomagnum ishizawai]SMF96531.1 hypothetical protein SAMN02949497_3931 [Methylomagnum ishizawai]
MAEYKITIIKLQDKKIIDCFIKISKNLGFTDSKCNIQLPVGINYDINLSDDNQLKKIQHIIDSAAILTDEIRLSLNNGSFNISVFRGGARNQQKSPIYDELAFNFSDQNQNKILNDTKLFILKTINDDLNPFNPDRQLSGALTPEQEALQAIHQETLNRLEQLNEKLIQETQNFRERLDKEYADKSSKLNEAHDKQRTNLENEYADKKQELEAEKNSLEELRKSLDDRSNTHARRKIRTDILEEVKNRTEKFSLTDGTVKLRTPITVSMIILISILGLGAIQASYEFYQKLGQAESYIIYIISARLFAFTFGAVGSLIYFIRWLNRWFEQHAQAEFQLRQFRLDIERASWIVETTLEWNDAKGTTIPDKLLESLSKNLFNDSSQPPEPIAHPADQLASALLGSAASIKLKAGESEIDINPNKLNKPVDNKKPNS